MLSTRYVRIDIILFDLQHPLLALTVVKQVSNLGRIFEIYDIMRLTTASVV
jgi:hypothetical protein